VRIALGADAARVVRMVMRRGMVRAAAGLAAGAVVSIGAMRAVESMLFEVRTTDPATIAAVTGAAAGGGGGGVLASRAACLANRSRAGDGGGVRGPAGG
jgi:hypothetical protein